MLEGVAFLLILAAIAITFWRPLRRVRTALGVSHRLATGHAFMLLGLVLGLAALDRPASYAEDLEPILAFVAGWVGFATGMRFELRVLRAVPLRAFAVASVPGLAAAAAVGTVAALVLLLAGAPETESFGAGVVLAAAAASSGPTLAAIVRTRRPGRAQPTRSVLRMIEFSAGFDDLLVVLLAMLAFALFRPGPEPIPPGSILALAVGGGAVLGVVTWLFLGGRAADSERMLLGLAMLAFIAGFGGWLHMSPASIAAVAAMVLVNLPGERMALLVRAVRRVERPAVVILMIAIGFHVAGPIHWTVAPLALAVTAVRLSAKVIAGDLVLGPIPGAPGLAACARWGYGLVPQGTLGLMVTLSFYHVWGDDFARSALAAVAIGSIVNEVLAQWLVVGLVRGLGARHAAHGSEVRA